MRDTPRLSPHQRESIATYGARTTWPAGFTVYERGTAASGLFIVLKGQIVLRNHVSTGRSFVPWVATPGETFGSEGLEPKGRYVTSARAEEESETLHLSAASFSALLREQPARALDLVRQLTAERTALLEKFCQHATLTVEQRLIASLIRMARSRLLDGETTNTAVPRRLLGELVGATRESISLVLGRLSSEGLVQRTGNGLVITDLERLEAKLTAPARSVALDVFDERMSSDQALH
ncbi:MAG TPA: Crp/Fnr family transcriptional regulator [Gemmatimonadaceae bacterium]|jgi:CRP-like cAMP-binding protein|nr:Crp/Fnr family transcriptional regulator [Gemmatimonadaceae bacterium]